MKFLFKRSLYIFAFILVSKGISAQALSDSASVVISTGTDNSTTITQVKTSIKNITKINYLGYCSNHQVFMLYIDTNYHGSPELFLSNLIKNTGITSLTLKEGTVEDIKNFCEFNDPADYDKQKKSNSN